MKNPLSLAMLLFLFSANAHAFGKSAVMEYTPEVSDQISEALATSLKEARVEDGMAPVHRGQAIVGKSEKELPCSVIVYAGARDVQVTVFEVEKEEDLLKNGMPYTRFTQFRWKAYNSDYYYQRVTALNLKENKITVGFAYKDVGGIAHSHSSDAVLSAERNMDDGLTFISVEDERSSKPLTCRGPWKRLQQIKPH